MLEKLFEFVFQLITKVADILLSPLILGISALFPDVSSYFGYINNFLDLALTYVHFLANVLLIPRGAITLFFSYLLIKYSIYLVKIAFNFVIKIYNILKP